MMFTIKSLTISRPAIFYLSRSSSTTAVDHRDAFGVRSYDEIPGPKPIPILGNVWRSFPVVGTWNKMSMNEIVLHMRQNYGDIVKLSGIPGRQDLIYVFRPEDAQKVFRSEGVWPVRMPLNSLKYYRTVLRKDIFQGVEGVITSQGKTWQEFRSKVNQPMMQPRSAKQYVTPINDVAEDFINRIRDFRDSKNEVPRDFINELYKWSLESIATVTLDTRLGCLSPDMKPDSEPQKMIEAVHVTLRGIFELDLRPSLWKYISTPMWRKYVKAQDVFTEVAMKYIKEAMDRIQSKPVDSQQELSMLERLLLSSENPMVACVMAVDMLFGGVDTTSHSTAIFLFHLAKNPEKQEILFQEVKRLLPESRSQPVTMEIFNELRYLRACLKESMRINPINFGNLRKNPEDIVLSNYHIPKGTNIFMCHQMMSRDKEHYSDPDSFIPERWLKGSEDQHSAHPFTTMPFGFGTRMCVGRRFAELEILILVAKIIRNFSVEYNEGDKLTIESRAINTVTSPLNFKLVDRE